MSKVDEFIKSGDAHLIAKVRVRDFLCEMKDDFPIKYKSTSQQGVRVYPSGMVAEWLMKWFGVKHE